MNRVIVGIDTQFVYQARLAVGLKGQYPYKALREYLESKTLDFEVLEMYAPVIRYLPKSTTAEAVLESFQGYERFKENLERQGINPIQSPAKHSGGGSKHSDDQGLMIRLALVCTRLKPEFLVLVAADGDFAPLVWGLREEGIRTMLVTQENIAAGELKRAAYVIRDMWEIAETATSIEDN